MNYHKRWESIWALCFILGLTLGFLFNAVRDWVAPNGK